MSEPIPEAIPTSADPRSRRPVKKIRTNASSSASAHQASEIEDLMWDPSRPVALPATSSEAKSKLAAPPEIVANVQGSSAGAGSGEFHVYKASRRREYERLREMDEEAKKEEEEKSWAQKEQERKVKDEERTRKNREKRNRRKGKGGDKDGEVEKKNDTTKPSSNGVKRPLDIPKKDAEDTAISEKASAFAVADVVKDNGITIHDDD